MHSVGCPLHVHVLGLFKPFNPLPNPQNEPPGGGGGLLFDSFDLARIDIRLNLRQKNFFHNEYATRVG